MEDHPPSFRGHFCVEVRDFNAVFARMVELDILETEAWGRIRELPGGRIQFYVRDPAGNLVEITSRPQDRPGISPAVFEHPGWGGSPYQSGLNDGRIYRPEEKIRG